MTLRPEVVREGLRKLREVVRNLRDLREIDESEFLSTYRHYWLAERGLQLAAETIFDVGMHVLSGAFNEHPEDHEAVTGDLGTRGVIDDDLEDRLTGIGGFRNVLVHGHLDVDRREVYRMVQNRLGDFTDFADQIETFLAEREE